MLWSAGRSGRPKLQLLQLLVDRARAAELRRRQLLRAGGEGATWLLLLPRGAPEVGRCVAIVLARRRPRWRSHWRQQPRIWGSRPICWHAWEMHGRCLRPWQGAAAPLQVPSNLTAVVVSGCFCAVRSSTAA